MSKEKNNAPKELLTVFFSALPVLSQTSETQVRGTPMIPQIGAGISPETGIFDSSCRLASSCLLVTRPTKAKVREDIIDGCF